MRKIFLLFCFLNFEFLAGNISEKTRDLKENQRIQEQLGKKLEDLAADILSGEKKLKNLSHQIELLSAQTSKLESSAKIQNKELSALSAQNEELLKIKTAMEGKIIALIAKDFAYDLPIPQGYIESEESFMAFEILSGLDRILSDEISKLSRDYEGVNLLIDTKQKQIEKINTNLKSYHEQIKQLQLLRQKQLDEINKQKTDRGIYAKKLDKLKAEQSELRATLDSLKIIDKKEQEREQNADKKVAKNTNSVRQIGSSYQNSSVKKYVGKKTIAPLDSFVVKQKFGNYIDPIYNIKIFNENVVLRSNKQDATVRSVLDGKIVFAKDTSMLQRVVIIEHNDGIHTIYAHLDKIAPTIKVGKSIKKGSVVGRIKNDLTFEVTQKNFHINPLELISLN